MSDKTAQPVEQTVGYGCQGYAKRHPPDGIGTEFGSSKEITCDAGKTGLCQGYNCHGDDARTQIHTAVGDHELDVQNGRIAEAGGGGIDDSVSGLVELDGVINAKSHRGIFQKFLSEAHHQDTADDGGKRIRIEPMAYSEDIVQQRRAYCGSQ